MLLATGSHGKSKGIGETSGDERKRTKYDRRTHSGRAAKIEHLVSTVLLFVSSLLAYILMHAKPVHIVVLSRGKWHIRLQVLLLLLVLPKVIKAGETSSEVFNNELVGRFLRLPSHKKI
jgi:hypothetical protein